VLLSFPFPFSVSLSDSECIGKSHLKSTEVFIAGPFTRSGNRLRTIFEQLARFFLSALGQASLIPTRFSAGTGDGASLSDLLSVGVLTSGVTCLVSLVAVISVLSFVLLRCRQNGKAAAAEEMMDDPIQTQFTQQTWSDDGNFENELLSGLDCRNRMGAIPRTE
jgi:hypothetical protein